MIATHPDLEKIIDHDTHRRALGALARYVRAFTIIAAEVNRIRRAASSALVALRAELAGTQAALVEERARRIWAETVIDAGRDSLGWGLLVDRWDCVPDDLRAEYRASARLEEV